MDKALVYYMGNPGFKSRMGLLLLPSPPTLPFLFSSSLVSNSSSILSLIFPLFMPTVVHCYYVK